jgi:programmed cell death 6-interacting protein
MSNLLDIPLKSSYPINIAGPARDYIQHHVGLHPDQFRDDIRRWQSLRKDAIGGALDPILLCVSSHTITESSFNSPLQGTMPIFAPSSPNFPQMYVTRL